MPARLTVMAFGVMGTLFPLEPLREPLVALGLPSQALENSPAAMALVAAHAWDGHGAARAGLTTGWVSRPELRFNAAPSRPHVEGETLSAVVERLLALPDA